MYKKHINKKKKEKKRQFRQGIWKDEKMLTFAFFS